MALLSWWLVSQNPPVVQGDVLSWLGFSLGSSIQAVSSYFLDAAFIGSQVFMPGIFAPCRMVLPRATWSPLCSLCSLRHGAPYTPVWPTQSRKLAPPLNAQVVDVMMPACNGQGAAAAVRLLQLLLGRMGGNTTAAALDMGGTATCVPAVAVQQPTAAAINRALYCGFPQVLR